MQFKFKGYNSTFTGTVLRRPFQLQYNAAKLEDRVKMSTFLLLLYLVFITTTFPNQNYCNSEVIVSCRMILQHSLSPGGRLLLKKGEVPCTPFISLPCSPLLVATVYLKSVLVLSARQFTKMKENYPSKKQRNNALYLKIKQVLYTC